MFKKLQFSVMNSEINLQTEAEVGIVEKVVVTNFMCHKKLEVNLGSNVNFIIGRNGSKLCILWNKRFLFHTMQTHYPKNYEICVSVYKLFLIH